MALGKKTVSTGSKKTSQPRNPKEPQVPTMSPQPTPLAEPSLIKDEALSQIEIMALKQAEELMSNAINVSNTVQREIQKAHPGWYFDYNTGRLIRIPSPIPG